MSELLAASGAALALYYLIKQRTAVGACGVAPGAPVQQQMEACRNVERPPNTWFEALLYFKEVFKCVRQWGFLSSGCCQLQQILHAMLVF